MQAWVAFTVTALALVAILALFLPGRQVLLLGIAAAAGIIAATLFHWHQMIYLISAVCVVSAVLGYLWPWKAWQWGLVPFLANAIWQILGPYSTVAWTNLGPIPYFFAFYSNLFLAILPMVAAELVAYFTRRRQAKPT
jgi:hypothetical protein